MGRKPTTISVAATTDIIRYYYLAIGVMNPVAMVTATKSLLCSRSNYSYFEPQLIQLESVSVVTLIS